MLFTFTLVTWILYRPVVSWLDVPLSDEGCADDFPQFCVAKKASCSSSDMVQEHCKKTCDLCPNEGCEDEYPQFCEGKKVTCGHSDMVDKHCKKTCGLCPNANTVCRDRNSQCHTRKRGCRLSSKIREICPLTCGICTINEDCEDELGELICEDGKEMCGESWAEEYRQSCQKTCGVCGGGGNAKTASLRKAPVRPEYDCEDRSGDSCIGKEFLCTSMDAFRRGCRKTCGLCDHVFTTRPPPKSKYSSSNGKKSVGGAGCQCGLPNEALIGNRIVGGTKVRAHKYSWQVALKLKRSSTASCGGTLINEKWVLSAAHCYMKSNHDPNNNRCWMVETQYDAVIGEHDQLSRRDNAPYFEVIPVKSHVEHPQFNCYQLTNDIALLELEKSVKFGKYENIYLLPICLPADDTNSYSGNTAYVSGWGLTTEGGKISQDLQEVKLTVANENCNGKFRITPDKLCAGAGERGKDACQGDSGGPLFKPDYEGYIQIGVVSSGYGCARDGMPGFYARISKFLDWINSITKYSDGYCMRN